LDRNARNIDNQEFTLSDFFQLACRKADFPPPRLRLP
jgi:hypothetical protein